MMKKFGSALTLTAVRALHLTGWPGHDRVLIEWITHGNIWTENLKDYRDLNDLGIYIHEAW